MSLPPCRIARGENRNPGILNNLVLAVFYGFGSGIVTFRSSLAALVAFPTQALDLTLIQLNGWSDFSVLLLLQLIENCASHPT
jgi:hypothetical protein